MLNTSLLNQFTEWLNSARAHEHIIEPTAMTLATLAADDFPNARIVLLKEYDENGFIFYTNYEGAKAQQLTHHNKAALCFYWMPMKRQIRIQGEVEKVSAQQSDAYFATRHRSSRIGAWASAQSTPLESREAFERSLKEWDAKFEGKEVPRPPHWGGYRVKPTTVEFWEERDYRLHIRDHYTISPSGDWEHQLLSP